MDEDQLLKLANSGDKDALYQLGCLAEDVGEIEKAKTWYHKAAEAGNPAALNVIGLFAQTEGDLESARNWFEKAANAGYSMALNNLGVMSEDPNEAIEWFKAGIKAGNTLAMYNLGIKLQQAGNEKESLKHFLASAKLGESISMVQLGLIAEEANNLEEAKDWYLQAVKLGNIQAMCSLGFLEHNFGNLAEAIKWYEEAAKQDHEDAIFQLGKIAYQSGDIAQAIIWWEKSALLGHPDSIEALEQTEFYDENDEENEEFEFRNDALRIPYMDYLSGDQKRIDRVEERNPDLFQMFEELKSHDLLMLWGDWSMDFEHPFSYEALEEVSSQLNFLSYDLQDELSEEQLEEQDWEPKRLSVRSEFFPTNNSLTYKFNIEGGDCAISAKAPQVLPVNQEEDTEESASLNEFTGIDCKKHKNSKECYKQKCDANMITIASGFGDGVYGVTCFDNLNGDVECVIAYFFWPADHEYVENLIISNDLDTPGFIEGHVPIYLGRLSSNGEFHFGDAASWVQGRDDMSWNLVKIKVPSDEYLVIGWIDPKSSFDRVLFVGLYRNQMKDYLEKVMDFYPAMKTFAESNVIFEFGAFDI